MSRTLCLGLDGATPQFLFRWMEEGHLPNLAALRDRAEWGALHSTRPAMTLPAWSSFLTGTLPGEHGIFDFTMREPGTGRLRVVDARDRMRPTIPEVLSAAGERVGSFFFPTTWPPVGLSGGQVSGFDSPVATLVPPEAFEPRALFDLSREVLERPLAFAAIDELRKDVDWEERAEVALLEGIADKERFALELIRRSPPYDFFALLFGESDTVAHHFWHLADPSSPRHLPELAPRFGGVIRRVYERLDLALGRILEADPGFESVVIASDHGFGGSGDRILHINSYLAEQGLLGWKPGPIGQLGGALRDLARVVPSGLREHLVRRLPERLITELDGASRFAAVDFGETLCFSDERDYAPSLWLNLEGREARGKVPSGSKGAERRAQIVARITRALLDWRDPIDGGPVVQGLVPREDYAQGPAADRAPDFLIELRRPQDYTYCVLPSEPGGPSFSTLSREDWSGAKGAGMAGSHREDGVYLLSGPGIEPGRRDARIEELLPRWMRARGQGDLWAQVAQGNPGDGLVRSSVESSFSSVEDVGALQERLSALGYLP